ncbi:MAG: ABC transporter ATP-binding protein [Rhizobiaceae bacterium]
MTSADKQRRIEKGSLRRLFRVLGPRLKPHWKKLALASFAMILATAMEIAAPWPMKIVFDGLLIPQANLDPVTAYVMGVTGGGDMLVAAVALAILVLAVFGGIFTFTQSYLMASAGQKVVAGVRFDLYRHIQGLSHSFHDQSSLGDIVARLTADVRMMRDLLINAVIFFAARILVVGGTVAVMAWMDWQLTLAALVVFPLLFFVSSHFGERIRGAARKQRKKEGKIANVMSESISAITVVKGFAREAYEESRFAKQNDSSLQAGLVATRLEGHMDRLVQVVLALGACIVLWYGIGRVRAGAITPGDLLVFTAYLQTLYKPIRKLANMTGSIAKAVASGERLLEIFDLKPDVREADDAIDAPRFGGEITFHGVSFSYANGTQVLKNANLRLEAGKTTAFIGASGGGKSTIAKLLLRFYDPVSGQVQIDGVDIKRYKLASLREQIAVVLQESVLFATSIRDNIAYGKLDASDEEVAAAAVEAGADEFIRGLPGGYDTVVGERGATLSGGQRQRIAIARAILRDASILILDEPLTGLDARSAREVAESLRRAAKGRTTILISHDELSLQLADRVVRVFNGGLYPGGARIALEQAS